MIGEWQEKAVRFGKDNRLAGIWCEPPAAEPARDATLIFISAGLLHHSGPHRLYTEMARRLAGVGFASLRFDLGGIGNSRAITMSDSGSPQPDSPGAEASAMQDVSEALNFVSASTGHESFVLCGLCSGAETAHRTALVDARVCGLLLFEGYIFPTPAYYAWHYLPRLLSWRKWRDFIAQRLDRLAKGEIERNEADAADGLWQGFHTSRDQVAEELRHLCARRIRQLMLFAGGTGDCSYPGQFRRVFRDVDFAGCITTRYLSDADHMYILQHDRDALLAMVDEWLLSNFAAEERIPQQQKLTGRSLSPATTGKGRRTHISREKLQWNPPAS